MNRYKKKLKDIGLLTMSLQAAGGAANSGAEFVLNEYIKIHSIFSTGAFCYMFFPELQSATNLNSIFLEINSIAGSVGTVNPSVYKLSFNAGNFIRFDVPLIVKFVRLYQGTASPAAVQVFYENYSV